MKNARLFPLFAYLFLLLGAGSELCSQTLKKNKGSLDLEINVSRFMSDSSFTRMEIYQSVGRSGLAYEKGADYSAAQFSLETVILQNDSTIFRDKTIESDSVKSIAEIKPGQQFVYTVVVFLQPGQYEVRTRLQDDVASRSRERRLVTEVSTFSADSLAFSDIQFATSIRKAENGQSINQKNNLLITPNPRAQYGDGNNKLTFYSELYNLGNTDDGQGTYRVDYIIEDQDSEPLHTIKGKERHKVGKHAAIFASFDISDLPSAIYRLRLAAHDDDTGLEAITEKEFSVIWEKDVLAKLSEQEENLYATLDEAALENYFAKIHYIATTDEKNIFNHLEQEGKQSFLAEFWRKRDPTPGTQINEFKEEYIRRLIQVNALFSKGHIEGWKTDRGRVLLTYGPPDFVDREPESADKKAFEVWDYTNLEGGVIFVFVDLKSSSLYELVHSTYRKEISFPNWESYLDQ